MNIGEITKLILKGVDEGAAAAAAKSAVKRAKAAGKGAARLKPGDYVRDRQRTAFPGIYGRPDEVAAAAAKRVAPESPALKDLFGVTREDLFDMSMASPRVNPSVLTGIGTGRGSEAARNVMTERNTQRITDTLGEAMQYPGLLQGMGAWYNLDPAYDVVKRVTNDPESAFRSFNAFSGMASPASDVVTEMRRGLIGNYMYRNNRMDEYLPYLVNPKGAPADIAHMPGHAYGGTSHAVPMKAFADAGEVRMTSPKVPPYIQSSLPAELGGTWTVPVGDAHFARGIGLADTRKAQDYAKSVSHPEINAIAPWFSDISGSLGLQAVPGQALAWGTFAPFTGVETAIGKPKLEILADEIMRSAKRTGDDPRRVRDEVLAGRRALSVGGATAAGAGVAGGLLSSPGRAQADELTPSQLDDLDRLFGGK